MSKQEERKTLLQTTYDETCSEDDEDDHRTNPIAILSNSRSNLSSPVPNDLKIVVIKDKKSTARNRYVMPDEHTNLSLCACCMFCPIGICAVMQSYQVQNYFEMGDLDKSRETSQQTLKLAKKAISIGCIIISCIVAFLLTIALIVTALFKPNDYY